MTASASTHGWLYSRRIWALIFAIVIGLVVVLLSHNGHLTKHMKPLMDLLDDPIELLKLDKVEFDSLFPKELQEQIDSMLSRTKKWSETLDFKVGRNLAAQGAKPKHPVVLIPGIISTGLESWTVSDSNIAFFRKRLWGSMSMLRSALFDRDEWVRQLMLDPVTGLDPAGVRVRAAKGLDAASYFAAGYWIWSKIIENLAAVGYDINQIYLASYDWRLSTSNLEVRDHYFSELKSRLELNLEVYKEKTVLVAHSMGSNVAFYFLKWAEYHLGAKWVDKHVDSFVNLSGPMLGVPKAMAALMTGEMRDTVQVPAMLSSLLERFLSSQERAQLFRSWAGSASLMLKGGDVIWGNHDSAPDDTANATSTHGVLMKYTEPAGRNSSMIVRALSVAESYPWILMHTPKEFQEMLYSNYSFGFERDPKKVKKNNANPSKWTNPLEVALPNAPNMKVYCVYGWNQPTERSYWMREMPPVDLQGQFDSQNFSSSSTFVNGTSPVVPSMSRIDPSIHSEKAVPKVNAGCDLGEGDGTVSILSLGSMCVTGWKQKRYNPANIKVVTHEVFHVPDAFDLRGGASSGDHIDILGSHDLNEVVTRVASGMGDTVEERILSPIRDYASKIDW